MALIRSLIVILGIAAGFLLLALGPMYVIGWLGHSASKRR